MTRVNLPYVIRSIHTRDIPEYMVWATMIKRCENPNSPLYANYGAKGIKVCAEWRNSFDKFYSDMGPRPSDMHSIDRIDNESGYEPSNCRWATKSEQQFNRRMQLIEYNGTTASIAQWSKITGLSPAVIRHRINTAKWSIDRALNTPANPTKLKGRKK